jgi:peptide/nickel transport system ATP-binding protein
MDPILTINNLTVAFGNTDETIAVNDISLELRRGEILALAGESGSGKTVTALSIIRLVDPPGFIKQGSIMYEDRNVLELNKEALTVLRGNEIAMIFQEPSSAYDQFFSIGQQFAETIKWHLKLSSAKSRQASIQWLSKIGFQDPQQIYNSYPFQLSGGMQQRAMIAMALCCKPSILIADEPTTSLDVISQAQIMKLILNIKKEMELTVLLISHDFGLIAQATNRVAIMYRGRIVEVAPTDVLYSNPAHPYTQVLLKSIADFKTDSIPQIPAAHVAQSSDAETVKQGCPYYPRCRVRIDVCRSSFPSPRSSVPEHIVFCWKYD